MGESPGAAEARASVVTRPGSVWRWPSGASTGGMGSERAVMSGRASAADVVSRIIIHRHRVCRDAFYSTRYKRERERVSPGMRALKSGSQEGFGAGTHGNVGRKRAA
jgi:hypothetical protein